MLSYDRMTTRAYPRLSGPASGLRSEKWPTGPRARGRGSLADVPRRIGNAIRRVFACAVGKTSEVRERQVQVVWMGESVEKALEFFQVQPTCMFDLNADAESGARSPVPCPMFHRLPRVLPSLLLVLASTWSNGADRNEAALVFFDQPGLTAEQLGVIVNDADPDSVATAAYYAKSAAFRPAS